VVSVPQPAIPCVYVAPRAQLQCRANLTPKRSFDILQVNFNGRLEIFGSAAQGRAAGGVRLLRLSREDSKGLTACVPFVIVKLVLGLRLECASRYAEAFRRAALRSVSAVVEARRI